MPAEIAEKSNLGHFSLARGLLAVMYIVLRDFKVV